MIKEICKNCTYYSAYYKLRVAGYEKQNFGTCSIQKQESKKKDTCEHFKRDELKKKAEKKFVFFARERRNFNKPNN